MAINIYNGDCFNLFKEIDDNSIDMVLTDLPYGTTKLKWDVVLPFDKIWIELKRVCKKDSAILLFGTEPFSSLARVSNLENYKFDWIWDKITARGHLVAKFRPYATN